LADHRVEFVDLVVRQDLGLQLRGARQRVAVDLQQLVGGTASLAGSKSLTLASRKRSVLRMRR
jgi:hypothetical protein